MRRWKQFWTCGELARELGLTRQSIYRACVRGKIAARRTPGGHLQIPDAEVSRLLGAPPPAT